MSLPIEKSLADIRTDLYSRVASVQQDGFLPQSLNLNRGPVRGLIELWAWGLYQLYQFLILVLGQVFPETATGKWLDLHCAQVRVTRQAATKAEGKVIFSRSGTSGNVPIKSGRVVRTKPDGLGNVYRFVTTADAVLADGQTQVTIPVISEEYGAAANVTTGAICEISTSISGVDAVTNASGWLDSEGADEEEDDALRERYFLAWQEVNGATKYAYISWARSVTGVVSVKILDQHPRGQGTVDVIVRSTAGVPTQNLLDDVTAVVEEKRPINDDVETRGPSAVTIDLVAELELVSGDAAEIVAEAETRVRAIFTDPETVSDVTPIQVGEDLTLDRLTHVIMAVSGIKRINWTAPAADVTVEKDGLAVLGTLSLSTAWASEE